MTHPYASRQFAESLNHWGEPFFVPEWGCHVLLREIKEGVLDAAGVYPITPLSKEADIAGGLERLKHKGAISVVLVCDDFNRPVLEKLSEHFCKVDSFKSHYLYRPAKGAIDYSSHHRRALRKAQQQVEVGLVNLRDEWTQWAALYDGLIEKLQLKGLHAFPHTHHKMLAELNGVVAIGAWQADELVSCHLWVEHEGYCHSHLVASNAAGYDASAATAVNHFSIQHFAKATMLNFGGGAGNSVDSDDGLARFKRGFANDIAQSYICGAVLDQEKYDALCAKRNFGQPVSFFPAYRA